MSKIYDNNNIFARIIRGEAKSEKIYEDEFLIAINDIFPAAPTHILAIPKASYISFDDFMAKAESAEVQHFFKKIKDIANEHGLAESGYRLITNHGSDASQTVPHFHVHILGGKQMGGLIASDSKIR